MDLQDAQKRLTREQFAVYEYFLQGKQNNEIAQILKISRGAVHKRKKRALEILKD
jgi:DNA-binding NarL/FixJ family response regulator